MNYGNITQPTITSTCRRHVYYIRIFTYLGMDDKKKERFCELPKDSWVGRIYNKHLGNDSPRDGHVYGRDDEDDDDCDNGHDDDHDNDGIDDSDNGADNSVDDFVESTFSCH